VEIGNPYPRRFGKFVLISPLAKGGMGELHLAYSGRADLKKLCVIKTILAHLADEEFVTRFVDEAKVVVKLSHGNLVPVFEAGEVEGQFFVAMEYIEGRDLRDFWNRLCEAGRICPLDLALFIVREICRGLSYVHGFEELHLVHRDVSPPNVLLSYTGEVKLTDFGVATSTIKLQKTAPGILLGKLSYMSPEQAKNEPVDARADVYSAGVILWELLTGERLFPPDKSQLERYERAVNPVIPPPSMVNKLLPPSLDLIVLRALAPQRESRLGDAELFRRELASVLAKLSPTTDTLTLATLLKELYGAELERERDDRRQLLEAMAPEIRRLMDASGTHTASPGAAGKPALATEPTEATPAPAEAPALPRLADGTVLDERYRIEQLIGEGGMGTVYVASHIEIEKQVAVKVLHPVYSRMPDVVSRFRAEARAASRIGHPHIVEVFDSGTTSDGSIYFVMEKLDGVDLADVIDSEERLSVERTIHIATQICEALAAAHEAGIVHRDLKPENIFLITREGDPDFVKVLDFGIAKNIELDDPSRERLTYPGMAMGTPEYMAPEQAAGQKTDHRVDIYATGALLYEMLVGKPPHEGDNLLAVLSAKATDPVVPPRQLRQDIPELLEQVVLWALAFNPADRPQSMSQLTYELNKLTRGRAGAVASLLGIPGISGPPAGPTQGPGARGGGPLRPVGSGTERVAAIDVAMPLPWKDGRGAKRWLLPGAIMISALLVSGALALRYLRRTSANPPPRPDAAALVASPDLRAPARDLAAADRPAPPDDLPPPEPDLGPQKNPKNPKNPKVAVRPPAQALLAAGQRHLRAAQFEPARHAFEAAVRSPRTKGAALVGLAEVEFQLARYSRAEAYARQALKAGGGLRARLVLANMYFKQRKYQQAVAAYKEVLALDPNHKEAKRNLAAAKQRLGQ